MSIAHPHLVTFKMATTVPSLSSKQKRIQTSTRKKSTCCPIFKCQKEQDHGYIQGEDYPLKSEELEPLTTYFHRALYQYKTINGTKMAIDFYDRPLTFNELSTFSTAMALQLTERVTLDESNTNPGVDTIFAICLPLSEKLIPTIFAILKTGASYLPLDPSYPESVLLSIINRFSPKVLITDESGPILCKYNSEDFSDVCKIISIEELWMNIEIPNEDSNNKSQGKLQQQQSQSRRGPRGSMTAQAAQILAATLLRRRPSVYREEPAVYSFITDTAPTTDKRLALVVPNKRLISNNPQGVRISHLNIMNRLSWEWRNLPFAKNGNCCLTVPVSSSESIPQIFGPLLKGITLHVLAKRDMKMMGTFIHVIGDKAITRICFSPAVFHDFINECSTSFEPNELKSILQHLKYVICRGRLLKGESVVKFLNLFPNAKLLCCLYGHPELTGDVICEKFKSGADVEHKAVQERLVIGKALSNTRIYILDSNLNQVEEGEEGQICVSGLPVVLGYVDTSVDVGSFIQNPLNKDNHPNFNRLFCTGDYGRMIRCQDKKLRLFIEGRMDNVIQHQGNDITLDDIQRTLLTMEEIDKVSVQLRNPGHYDQAVIAYIILKARCKDTTLIGELDFQLRSKLPEFMIPELVFVEELPTTLQTVTLVN